MPFLPAYIHHLTKPMQTDSKPIQTYADFKRNSEFVEAFNQFSSVIQTLVSELPVTIFGDDDIKPYMEQTFLLRDVADQLRKQARVSKRLHESIARSRAEARGFIYLEKLDLYIHYSQFQDLLNFLTNAKAKQEKIRQEADFKAPSSRR